MGNKYLQFTLEEWLLDDDFIAYIKGENKEFQKTIDTVVSKSSEQRSNIEAATQFLRSFDNLEETRTTISENKLWDSIDSQIEEDPNVVPISKKTPFSSTFWMRIAAVGLVVLLALTWLFQPTTTYVETSSAEQKTYSLPDGSIVVMNAESTISYSKSQWEHNRRINLEGEAFFTVNKGSTFEVRTKKGRVEVLGTQFNISTYDDFEVTCKEGKVRVSTKKSTAELVANEGVRLIDEKLTKEPTMAESVIAWKKGIFYFKNEKLIEVVRTIERQFNVQIDLDKDLYDRPFTGKIEKQQAILEVFQSIMWPLNLNFKKSDKGFTIFDAKK